MTSLLGSDLSWHLTSLNISHQLPIGSDLSLHLDLPRDWCPRCGYWQPPGLAPLQGAGTRHTNWLRPARANSICLVARKYYLIYLKQLFDLYCISVCTLWTLFLICNTFMTFNKFIFELYTCSVHCWNI